MLFERIESPGLAHYSYVVGDGNQAVVIDPRRDVDVYVDKAAQGGQHIAHVVETHRNEDYLTGSLELAARTGAQIWHADAQLDYGYGQPAEEGQTWPVGRLKLQALHTPGHTPGHMSYLLHDPGDAPWVVFTGDALFAGEVGRVDFLGPDRAVEMGEALYDTLFDKLLPLGDQVIVCPAHGSGSVCGSGIAERVWTTIGLERQLNPRLRFTQRDAFAAHVAQASVEMEQAPYFRQMEKLNLAGPPLLGPLPVPPPLTPDGFAGAMEEAVVLDTRDTLAFSAAHVPEALSIPLDNVPSFAGWYLPYDRPILLVTGTADPRPAVRYLIRQGYDQIAGTLAGGMLAWHRTGRESQATATTTVQQLCHLLDARQDPPPLVLDVRSEKEAAATPIPDAQNVHLTQLPERKDEVPRDRPTYVFCGSGIRATTAVSLLQRAGWTNLVVVLGGLAGWQSVTCPLPE